MHVSPNQAPSQGPSVEDRLREDRIARLHDDESGQSLIESALVFPVLLLIVTGVLAFGLAFNNYIALTNAVGVGARQIAISRGQTLDPCLTASSAISGAAPLLKSSNITFTFTLNGTDYSGTSCSSSSTTTGAAGNLVQGKGATIHVSYPCSLVVYKINLVPGCTLQAQITELVQ
ncbi:MAG: TadE family protein [Acidobacteriota bacterium]